MAQKRLEVKKGFLGGCLWVQEMQETQRYGFNPWVGKIPWRKERLPSPVFGLENSMDLVVHEVAKSRTQLSAFHFYFSLLLFYVVHFTNFHFLQSLLCWLSLFSLCSLVTGFHLWNYFNLFFVCFSPEFSQLLFHISLWAHTSLLPGFPSRMGCFIAKLKHNIPLWETKQNTLFNLRSDPTWCSFKDNTK